MKFLHILFVGLIFALLLSCAPEKKNKLEGVWEKVSGKLTTPESTTESTQADRRTIKVITKSHFVTVSQHHNRPKFTEGGTDSEILAAAKTFSANGGKYTLEGDTYTEHIEFFLNPNMVGASVTFKYKLEGGQLTISGTIPAKSLGLADYDMKLTEVWKRIE